MSTSAPATSAPAAGAQPGGARPGTAFPPAGISNAEAAWDRTTSLGAALAGIDDVFDRAFDRVRGRRGPDSVAAVLSNLSDYGFVWAVVAAWKGRRGDARRPTVLALGAAGVSSYLVNKTLKSLFRRQRPAAAGDGTRHGPAVRAPTSSSFPSGHTLASFCTAVVLAEDATEMAAFVGFATAVAASRVHLRAHHPSDVLAGAAVGTVLGAAARHLLGRGLPGRGGE